MSVPVTIVFFDVVNFSGLPSRAQKELVESLNAEVRAALGTLIVPSQDRLGVLAMPTGDGMALAFVHEANPGWDDRVIFDSIYKLQKWAYAKSGPAGKVELRIGVHSGLDELITDINQKPNICGATINSAQRVMDAANGRQVLFSDVAFRQHIGHAKPLYAYSPNCVAHFEGPIDVQAKHKMRMLVYKMTLAPPADWWSNDDPKSKDLMTVSLTPLPKEIVGSFSERIAASEDIAFIQLTGDRVLEALKSGKIKLSERLKRFWVFMPNADVYSSMDLPTPYPVSDYVNKCVQEWKNYFAAIKPHYGHSILKLGLFKEPPFFSASFADWQKQGGKIHVSPYIWGCPAEDCPGYELVWAGPQPPTIYEAYVAGLDALNSRTTNIA